VLSEDEARAIAVERRNFVRVTRSEVDLPAGTDSHSEIAYRKARENLDSFVRDGLLVQDAAPTYYLYGQVMGTHVQHGFPSHSSVVPGGITLGGAQYQSPLNVDWRSSGQQC